MKMNIKRVTLAALFVFFLLFVVSYNNLDVYPIRRMVQINPAITEREIILNPHQQNEQHSLRKDNILYPWPSERLKLIPGEEKQLSFLNYLGDDCAKGLRLKNHATTLSEVASKEYLQSNAELENVIRKRGRNPVGHSNQAEMNRIIYWKVANRSSVKTICEIGFNMGHSTLIWLHANPTAKIYSFDIGSERNTRYYADYLQGLHPGRIEMIWGDSARTVPLFARQHPDVKCDLLIVDGGHSFKCAYTDLEQFRAMANPDFHLVMMDDTPVTIMDVIRAWGKAKQMGFLQPHLECAYWFLPDGTPRRGVSVGQYTQIQRNDYKYVEDSGKIVD